MDRKELGVVSISRWKNIWAILAARMKSLSLNPSILGV